MTALGAQVPKFVAPNGGMTQLEFEIAATSQHADTFTFDMSKYGGSVLRGILGFEPTSAGVVITQAPTTTVSGTTATVTIGGSNDSIARTFIVWIA